MNVRSGKIMIKPKIGEQDSLPQKTMISEEIAQQYMRQVLELQTLLTLSTSSEIMQLEPGM